VSAKNDSQKNDRSAIETKSMIKEDFRCFTMIFMAYQFEVSQGEVTLEELKKLSQ
jgi:hypothetical protein